MEDSDNEILPARGYSRGSSSTRPRTEPLNPISLRQRMQDHRNRPPSTRSNSQRTLPKHSPTVSPPHRMKARADRRPIQSRDKQVPQRKTPPPKPAPPPSKRSPLHGVTHPIRDKRYMNDTASSFRNKNDPLQPKRLDSNDPIHPKHKPAPTHLHFTPERRSPERKTGFTASIHAHTESSQQKVRESPSISRTPGMRNRRSVTPQSPPVPALARRLARGQTTPQSQATPSYYRQDQSPPVPAVLNRLRQEQSPESHVYTSPPKIPSQTSSPIDIKPAPPLSPPVPALAAKLAAREQQKTIPEFPVDSFSECSPIVRKKLPSVRKPSQTPTKMKLMPCHTSPKNNQENKKFEDEERRMITGEFAAYLGVPESLDRCERNDLVEYETVLECLNNSNVNAGIKGLLDIIMVPKKKERVARLPQTMPYVRKLCGDVLGGDDVELACDAVACLRLLCKGQLADINLASYEFRKYLAPPTSALLAAEVGRLMWVRFSFCLVFLLKISV